MGFPASGLESAYRNPVADVARFLTERHSASFLVLNLSERDYPPESFSSGSVVPYGFPDHHSPPLDRAWGKVEGVIRFLTADPTGVVVVHCMAGKGRTGCIVSALLVRSLAFAWVPTGGDDAAGVGDGRELRVAGASETALRALRLFRMRRGEGVTYAAQARTAMYWAVHVQAVVAKETYEFLEERKREEGGVLREGVLEEEGGVLREGVLEEEGGVLREGAAKEKGGVLREGAAKEKGGVSREGAAKRVSGDLDLRWSAIPGKGANKRDPADVARPQGDEKEGVFLDPLAAVPQHRSERGLSVAPFEYPTLAPDGTLGIHEGKERKVEEEYGRFLKDSSFRVSRKELGELRLRVHRALNVYRLPDPPRVMVRAISIASLPAVYGTHPTRPYITLGPTPDQFSPPEEALFFNSLWSAPRGQIRPHAPGEGAFIRVDAVVQGDVTLQIMHAPEPDEKRSRSGSVVSTVTAAATGPAAVELCRLTFHTAFIQYEPIPVLRFELDDVDMDSRSKRLPWFRSEFTIDIMFEPAPPSGSPPPSKSSISSGGSDPPPPPSKSSISSGGLPPPSSKSSSGAATGRKSSRARKTMRGWLWKKGEISKGFKKRYCVLSQDGILSYYVEPKESVPKGTISMNDATGISNLDDEPKRPMCFKVATPSRVYIFQAPTEDDRIQWIQALQYAQSRVGTPIYARKTSSSEEDEKPEHHDSPIRPPRPSVSSATSSVAFLDPELDM